MHFALHGKSEQLLPLFPENYFDSIVTDPPYGLKFMGHKWDYDVPSVAFWKECFRVLKPGGYLLSFGGTRTYHRMVVNIEDAGFVIRDQMQWIYGQGFPKSINVGDGWGTALKPANEPICMARKPIGGTVQGNILEYGTGAINIDGSRIPFAGDKLGRFPSNVIMDAEAGAVLDQQFPTAGAFANVSGRKTEKTGGIYNKFAPVDNGDTFYGDAGGPSRFFYCPKPNAAEKDKGLLNFELKKAGIKNASGRGYSETDPYKKILRRNTHPTVKPVDLMRYLVKMVTPKGGICLDPCGGSGTTICGAKMELINGICIDEEEECVITAAARIAAWNPNLYKPQELF